jgi:hypothetical protein
MDNITQTGAKRGEAQTRPRPMQGAHHKILQNRQNYKIYVIEKRNGTLEAQ